MKQKPHALAGMAAPLVFAGTYLILTAGRPEFGHFTSDVSELGAVSAPDAATWNLFGYICPGILIALFSIGLHEAVGDSTQGWLPFYGLFFSGIFMTLAGVFPGDFKNPASLTTLLHSICSIGSFTGFLMAAFMYPLHLRKSQFWEKTIIPSLTCSWLCILSGFLRIGITPGIGQRAGFLLYFLWIGFMAVQLLRYQRIIDG